MLKTIGVTALILIGGYVLVWPFIPEPAGQNPAVNRGFDAQQWENVKVIVGGLGVVSAMRLECGRDAQAVSDTLADVKGRFSLTDTQKKELVSIYATAMGTTAGLGGNKVTAADCRKLLSDSDDMLDTIRRKL